MKTWLLFALSAALFWGAYVPTIYYGQQGFGAGNPNRSMKAFLFVGLAYFVMAIVVPGLFLMSQQPSPKDTGWPMWGVVLSTLAGLLGAAGALCVVFALRHAFLDNPKYMIIIAPIVFAGAPIVNVFVSYAINWFKGEAHLPHPMFVVGLVLAAAGVATVLYFNPAAHGGGVKGKPEVTLPAGERVIGK